MELFVVTAIVGVLAALLLPALGRAREKSRRAVCVGRLRQIGQVTTLYYDLYRALPTEDYSGYLMWNGTDYVLNGHLVRTGGRHLASLFYCPSSRAFRPQDPDTGAPNLGITGKITASAYELRGLAQGGPRALDGTRLAVMADLFGGSEQNHTDGLNVLHTDGAVRFVVVPAGWSLALSNAWAQLDHEMIASAP